MFSSFGEKKYDLFRRNIYEMNILYHRTKEIKDEIQSVKFAKKPDKLFTLCKRKISIHAKAPERIPIMILIENRISILWRMFVF